MPKHTRGNAVVMLSGMGPAVCMQTLTPTGDATAPRPRQAQAAVPTPCSGMGRGAASPLQGASKLQTKQFLPFDVALEQARALRLGSMREWQQWCRSGSRPANMPADPSQTYRHDGWTAWGHWLGTGTAAHQKNTPYVPRSVQYHPYGGQFDIVRLSARTPHGVHRTCGEPGRLTKSRNTPTPKKTLPPASVSRYAGEPPAGVTVIATGVSAGKRREPFNSTPMAANPISPGSPHVRPMEVHRTGGS